MTHQNLPSRRRLVLGAALLGSAALALTGCGLPLPFGGSSSGGAVGFGDVQKATIQIEAVGTFVDPEQGGYEAAGRGSGFLIDDSGLAVTNNHVVVGAGTLKVWRGGDTTKTLNAKVLASSECYDLAVIKLEGSGYPHLRWRDKPVETALDVYAAGFPLGDPTFTETKGIVSKADTAGKTPWAALDHIIEHDARIRPGNSGGPLVDKDGAVVGVNYAGNDQYDTNLAIHRDEAKQAIAQLAKGKPVLSLGINGTALTDEDGNGLGIWVSSVASGSPADKAGIEGGDLLTKMEGVSLGADGTMSDYCSVLRTHGQDATLSVELFRPADNTYYRGQFNGKPIAAQKTIETATGADSGSSQVASGDFITVKDDSGTVSVQVPAAWKQTQGSPFTDDGGNEYKLLSAAPDINAFLNDWGAPGVSVYASKDAVGKVTPQQIMDGMGSGLAAEGCQSEGASDYDDGVHQGQLAMWSGCGPAKSYALVVSAQAKSGDYVVLVTLQAPKVDDLAAADRILGSFSARF
ncbi:S1C family serine protease [Microbacterium sp. Au-Mic1]|uniref:S1C family serine protease n=1 Tax=Microbacterium sp. Au-Mic1 TaxID=2906457 RepID=UPI001E551D8D|nr:trypsin-like peptidase domain-containing protein [Microbacterium sp. Au-Mic1]MCE4025442.1 S1C family serine protease [Microbacterium sp. Au-Mic1]